MAFDTNPSTDNALQYKRKQSFADQIRQANEVEQQIVMHSNRPPTNGLGGGVVMVLAGAEPQLWCGPDTSKIVADDEWADPDVIQSIKNVFYNDHEAEFTPELAQELKDSLRFQLSQDIITTESGKEIKVMTYPVPKTLQKAQYEVIANDMLWPIFHEMDPETYFDPSVLASGKDLPEKAQYTFDLTNINTFKEYQEKNPDVNTTLDFVNKAYGDFKAFSALSEVAIDKVCSDMKFMENGEVQEGALASKDDIVWIHDYQCLDMSGAIFSRHTPFPSVEYLQKVVIENGDEPTPLLESDFFIDYMKNRSRNELINFQRPVDMRNYIETLEVICPDFKENNGHLYNEGMLDIDETLGEGSRKSVNAFGHNFSIMTIPVGVSQENSIKEAEENLAMNKTQIDKNALARAGMFIDEGASPRSLDDDAELEDLSEGKVAFNKMLEENHVLDEGHQVFFSWHRNDFTKNTIEKLKAADKFLDTLTPEEKSKIHFVQGLQPTRNSVPGYREYQEAVIDLAKELREKHGDSIVVIPSNIEHGDSMGFLHHENVIGTIGAGLKDGHDLTVREAVDAKAGQKGAFTSIITSDGVGAADILGGDKENPDKGAYVLDTSKGREAFIDQMVTAIGDIVQKRSTEEGREELESRYAHMKEASAIYSAAEYTRAIKQGYNDIPKAKDYLADRGGEQQIG